MVGPETSVSNHLASSRWLLAALDVAVDADGPKCLIPNAVNSSIPSAYGNSSQ